MSSYSYDVRLLMCPNCGGALEVPLAGGHCECSYCGTTSVWQQRTDRAIYSEPIDEETRLAGLFEQAKQPDRKPPASIRHMFPPGGTMSPTYTDEALAAFQRARAEMARVADAGERIFFLTIGLYNIWSGPKNQTRQRALMETATELLREPGHRAVLQGMMARNACRAGDLISANRWLALMDPRSPSLRADSAYRLTRAYVETAQQRWPLVIDALGEKIGSVPLSPGDIAMCVVMRANAHEQAGDLATATTHLFVAMQQAPHLRLVCKAIIHANPTLGMCPASYRNALAHLERPGQGS